MARQGDLFSLSELTSQCTPLATPPLLQRQLSDWQRRLAARPHLRCHWFLDVLPKEIQLRLSS